MDIKHLKEVPLEELQSPESESNYNPHHHVRKEDSTTTKLRVVFDASSKTKSGLTVNDCIMVGATVEPDFFSRVFRLRFHQILLSADIAKMYRQFALDEQDKDFHRIVWTDTSQETIKHLRRPRLTYGIASSAFQSTRCLQKSAQGQQMKTSNKQSYR